MKRKQKLKNWMAYLWKICRHLTLYHISLWCPIIHCNMSHYSVHLKKALNIINVTDMICFTLWGKKSCNMSWSHRKIWWKSKLDIKKFVRIKTNFWTNTHHLWVECGFSIPHKQNGTIFLLSNNPEVCIFC